MRHASVNHKLFRSSSQTSVKSSAEEDGGETAKKKRRKSVLERRAHSRRQRLDGLMSQLELVTIGKLRI